MLSIYKKEMSQYFKSVSGYIFLAIFLAITAYYFTVDNMLAQTSDVKSYFSTMVFTLMFLVPILTMRSFAEEKRSRTDQLLLTAPIKPTKIVAGKFYAALTVLGIGLATTLVFVIVIAVYGSVDIITVIGCYVGIILATACFIAIGMFFSSITVSQVVAAVITYAVLLVLYLISSLADYLQNPFWTGVLDWVAIYRRFQDFVVGIFDISAAVYYISITVLCLFLANVMITRKGNSK